MYCGRRRTSCVSESCWRRSRTAARSRMTFSASAVIADHRITVECDENRFFLRFFPDVRRVSARSLGKLSVSSDIHLAIRARIHPDFGWFRMSGSNDLADRWRANSVSPSTLEQGAFRSARHRVKQGWKCIAFRGSDVPAFAFRGRDCLFALEPRWRASIIVVPVLAAAANSIRRYFLPRLGTWHLWRRHDLRWALRRAENPPPLWLLQREAIIS